MTEPSPDATLEMRLVGGALSTQTLADLALVSGDHADGHLYLTERAGLELRGIDLDAAGLLPSGRSANDIVVSPLSGRVGGQADLRTTAARLDHLLRDDPELVDLLFVLDDGRGDLLDLDLDVGVMAVDADAVQVRAGSDQWGEVIGLDEAPGALLDLARRGSSERSLHHARDLRTQVVSLPAPYDMITQEDGLSLEHLAVPDGDLTHQLATQVLARAGQDVVITPWHSILLVDLERT